MSRIAMLHNYIYDGNNNNNKNNMFVDLVEDDEERTESWHEEEKEGDPQIEQLVVWGLPASAVEIYALTQELAALREENALLRRENEALKYPMMYREEPRDDIIPNTKRICKRKNK
jgi:hypothetical protein